MNSTDYHNLPGLSSSGARKLLPPSCPAKFKWEQDNPPPPRDVFDFGHAAHSFVLGAGEDIGVIEAPDWRSKSAREERDAARLAGVVPLLRKDYDTAIAMADAVKQSPAGSLFTEGKPEQVYRWTDKRTGADLRAMFDWLRDDCTVIVDYKTAASADPGKFASAAFAYGYHVQAAWYLDGLREVEGVDDARFLFVVQEKSPPYLVTVVELDETAVEIGRQQARGAIDLYARCIETDTWPGYADDTVTVTAPTWAMSKYLDSFAPDDIVAA